MNKKKYLKEPDVKDFVEWFARAIDDRTITHSYMRPHAPLLSLNGLPDALKRYDWPFKLALPGARTVTTGSTYRENSEALGLLQQGLTAGLSDRKADVALSWSIAVMEWGGVRNGNVAWLTANAKGLTTSIKSAAQTLDRGDDSLAVLGPKIPRFNSGMSKIYSLVASDWIIYDSRVAAALSWFVAYWCIQTKQKSVPDLLRFPCMRPKEGATKWKSRNPSCGALHFPWMGSRPAVFASWNMRASWIVGDAIKRSANQSTYRKSSSPARALEAALFMWGYDLSFSPICSSGTKLTPAPTSSPRPVKTSVYSASKWRAAATQGGKQKKFEWGIDDNRQALLLRRSNKKPSNEKFDMSGLFLLMHRIYDEFGFDWVPLNNNVTKLRDGTALPGLGPMMYEIFGSNVSKGQAASQIGVILQHIGVFEGNDQQRGIAWRLKVAPPSEIEGLRSLLSDGEPLSGEC
jgi:hypothetical protein